LELLQDIFFLQLNSSFDIVQTIWPLVSMLGQYLHLFLMQVLGFLTGSLWSDCSLTGLVWVCLRSFIDALELMTSFSGDVVFGFDLISQSALTRRSRTFLGLLYAVSRRCSCRKPVFVLLPKRPQLCLTVSLTELSNRF
jgi:uncharacterized membrane protein